MNIGLVHDPIFQEHDAGSFHCESPDRLLAIGQALLGWPGFRSCQRMPLREATDEELRRVHTPAHLARIAATSGRNVSLDPDTAASPRSYEVARNAAGSLTELCERVFLGHFFHGLSLVRPPGHHATADSAMGFCLFNNVAVAAAHLMEVRHLKRILVIDWDVHHGNGTEAIFYDEKRVLYFSTHQSPLYPGTGPASSVGKGRAAGHNVNVPLSAGYGDREYVRVFEELLMPITRKFKPEFIIVSAGFDAHADDPLGSMLVSDRGFAAMSQIIMELSAEFCPGRVVYALEGGYNLGALATSIVSVLSTIVGHQENELRDEAKGINMPRALERAMDVHRQYWPLP